MEATASSKNELTPMCLKPYHLPKETASAYREQLRNTCQRGSVLVLAGIELIFFTVASTGLCFGFMLETL